ncbi:hypothetical protein RFI_25567 [Reticulomyxa filosa]|uniref:Uncharacterized protein n=1 Tax=Reticulomyxa filosa TaxID=46433 RepID=X6MDS9_RETFI|nr:hypothetical protein RFI_25567 [Reticulomyxa filosa]|eukprot:ETO11811.1 hypothetical protein RFI_25567 [Reticulomyxa filosa]
MTICFLLKNENYKFVELYDNWFQTNVHIEHLYSLCCEKKSAKANAVIKEMKDHLDKSYQLISIEQIIKFVKELQSQLHTEKVKTLMLSKNSFKQKKFAKCKRKACSLCLRLDLHRQMHLVNNIGENKVQLDWKDENLFPEERYYDFNSVILFINSFHINSCT